MSFLPDRFPNRLGAVYSVLSTDNIDLLSFGASLAFVFSSLVANEKNSCSLLVFLSDIINDCSHFLSLSTPTSRSLLIGVAVHLCVLVSVYVSLFLSVSWSHSCTLSRSLPIFPGLFPYFSPNNPPRKPNKHAVVSISFSQSAII